jgi:hypothetical protein
MTTSTTKYTQEQQLGQPGDGAQGKRSRERHILTAGVVVALVAVALLAAVSSGFGSTGSSGRSAVPATVPGHVSVTVTAPTSNSVIASDRVIVRGTVVPANAAVEIQGTPAAVGEGVFTGTATLHGGKTTIDVVGSYPGAAPGATSIVIARQSAGQPATVHVIDASPAVIVGSAGGGSGGYAGPRSCGGGLSVGPDTTCPFAEEVRSAYESHGPGVVAAYSPVTGQTYAMSCSVGSDVVCTGGENASVYFPAATAGAYSAPSQPAYASPSSDIYQGGTSCGGELSVGPNTTCAFAENVRSAFASQGAGVVQAYSPVTHRMYSMTCVSGSTVECTGGNGASVYFP